MITSGSLRSEEMAMMQDLGVFLMDLVASSSSESVPLSSSSSSSSSLPSSSPASSLTADEGGEENELCGLGSIDDKEEDEEVSTCVMVLVEHVLLSIVAFVV